MRDQVDILFDLVVNPTAAFERIRLRPQFFLATLTLLMLSVLGAYLVGPAQHNADASVLQSQFGTTNYYASYSDAGKVALAAQTLHPAFWHDSAFGALNFAISVLAALVVSLLLLMFSLLISKGATYKTLFAGTIHIAVVTSGASAVMSGLVTLLVGPSHYVAYDQIDGALNAAAFFPSTNGLGAVAQESIGPFPLWGLVLTAFFLTRTVGLRTALAWGISVVIFFGGLAAQFGLAAAQHALSG